MTYNQERRNNISMFGIKFLKSREFDSACGKDQVCRCTATEDFAASPTNTYTGKFYASNV
jgi:hypothetical protein